MKKIGVHQPRTDDPIQFKVVLPDGRFVRDSAGYPSEYQMAQDVYRRTYGDQIQFVRLPVSNQTVDA